MDINELKKTAEQYFFIALSHVKAHPELSGMLKSVLVSRAGMKEAELPGFEAKPLRFGRFENREFVVMTIDIRGSTHIINGPNGVINMFIIFYVYAGIVAKIVDFFQGTSTEFLGDGVLNLFDTKDNGVPSALLRSGAAAMEILTAKDLVLNPLFVQYGLPPISFGIGIDCGMTIVTKFGYRGDTDLKAFGRCVYNASKLSKGNNQVLISEGALNLWPAAEDGLVRFKGPSLIDGRNAYTLYIEG